MNKPHYPLKQIVEVEWVDSCSRGRWDSLERYKEERPALCKSVGYLLVKDKKRIVLALSQGDTTAMSNCVCDSMTIPRGCVTKIRKLKA